MLRARHVSSKSLRSSGWIAIRRAFSDTPGQEAANKTKSDSVRQEVLEFLSNNTEPLAADDSLQASEHDTTPEVIFAPSDSQTIEWESLTAELPDLTKGSRPPAHKPVTEGMRKRRAAYESSSIWNETPSPDPTPRLSAHEGKVRAKHGLLSPFDTLPLQEVQNSRKAPRIKHNLVRVLTNPGVHWLTEPRSNFDNFPSYLKEVPSASEFAFERLTGFVTSSRDSELLKLAKAHGCKFAGSTSSLTGMLSLIYLLMAEERPIDVSTLSAHYQKEPKSFTPGQRMPVSVTLRYKDGIYATDSHVEHMVQLGSTETVLSQLGTVMEKFFTMDFDKFKMAYMKRKPVSLKRKEPWQESYRYAMHNQFLMRAQLDCYSDLLPGSGIFDIKTRAAVPVRYDLEKYRDNPEDYRILTIQGAWMSFEKEYYDLIRSAFLKYSFQARIGNMDGVLVAYHNTREIFGFQYIPLEEMDQRLYGHSNGQRVFGKCVGLLDVLFTEITKSFPEQSVNCTFETDTKHNLMRVWVEPAEWEGPERPIVRYDVRLRHYIGRKKVSGSEAVGSRTGGWTIAYSIWKHQRPRELILKGRRHAWQAQMRIYKFGLSANERVERKDDVDPSHVDPLADAETAGPPDDVQSLQELENPSAVSEALASVKSDGEPGGSLDPPKPTKTSILWGALESKEMLRTLQSMYSSSGSDPAAPSPPEEPVPPRSSSSAEDSTSEAASLESVPSSPSVPSEPPSISPVSSSTESPMEPKSSSDGHEDKP